MKETKLTTFPGKIAEICLSYFELQAFFTAEIAKIWEDKKIRT
jgi:hypothetical protein